MTPKEAIENALEYIELQFGHKNGGLYEDLAEALQLLVNRHPKTMDVDFTKPGIL